MCRGRGVKEGGGSPNGAAVESGQEKTTKKKKKKKEIIIRRGRKNPPSEIYSRAEEKGKSFCCVFSQRINMQNRAVLLFSFLWKKKKVISEMGEQPLLIRNVARGPGRAGARTQRPPPRAARVHDRGEPARLPPAPRTPRSLEKVSRPSPLALAPAFRPLRDGVRLPTVPVGEEVCGLRVGAFGARRPAVAGGGGCSSYRSGGCAGMWRGESRGGRRLLSLLLHLPQPPPGEARGGRPPRAGAPRPREGRASGGARGLDEVRAGRAWSRGEGSGATAGGGGGPRGPGGGGQRAAARPPGPKGPAEVRAAGGPALWSPAAQHPLPRGGSAPAPRHCGPPSRLGRRPGAG